jgi:sulfur relay (sulfurtransferase) DsrF/TusC family protein
MSFVDKLIEDDVNKLIKNYVNKLIKNFNVANDSRLIKLYDRAKNVYDCSTLIN